LCCIFVKIVLKFNIIRLFAIVRTVNKGIYVKKTILLILLFAGLSCLIFAQDLTAGDLQLPALSLPDTEPFGITPMAYNPQYPAGFGGKLGFGLLNTFLGLGSYIAGDWGWGIGLTLWQGLGIAGVLGFGWNDITGGTFFDGFIKRFPNAGIGFLGGIAGGFIICLFAGANSSEMFWAIMIGTPIIGLLAGFCMDPQGYSYSSEHMEVAILSFGLWATGVIFGIIVPYLWSGKKSADQTATARPDDLRNWNVGLVPTADGRFAGQITFTAHF